MPMTPENATWFADAFSTIVNNVGQALLDMAAQVVPDIDVLAADLDLHGLAPIH